MKIPTLPDGAPPIAEHPPMTIPLCALLGPAPCPNTAGWCLHAPKPGWLPSLNFSCRPKWLPYPDTLRSPPRFDRHPANQIVQKQSVAKKWAPRESPANYQVLREHSHRHFRWCPPSPRKYSTDSCAAQKRPRTELAARDPPRSPAARLRPVYPAGLPEMHPSTLPSHPQALRLMPPPANFGRHPPTPRHWRSRWTHSRKPSKAKQHCWPPRPRRQMRWFEPRESPARCSLQRYRHSVRC